MTVIPDEIWRRDRELYLARLRPWACDYLRRRSQGKKHPVYDFLFEYYSFRPAHLLRWTPGFDRELTHATREHIVWSEFETCQHGLCLRASTFPDHRISYLEWAIGYLQATLLREPSFACMGLHEWAMVFRDPKVRHPYVPLRLSREETDRVVESQQLRCTHYDAFRFFSREAAPRNRWELTRPTTTDHDQPGCIHANMDLYRFAYKIAPYCPSSLIADSFDLALMAREVDMRASPYDLNKFGFPAIQIETADGRAEYVELQRELYWKSQPIREQVLDVYRGLHLSKTAMY